MKKVKQPYFTSVTHDYNSADKLEVGGTLICHRFLVKKKRKSEGDFIQFHLNVRSSKHGILGFGVRSTAQRIQNVTSNWNWESQFHWQRLESSTRNPESVTWNLESQTIVDSLTWGDLQVGLLNCFYFYNTEHDTMFSFWCCLQISNVVLNLKKTRC